MYNEQNGLGSSGMQAMIDKLGKIPLMSQPGERWRYSVAVDVQGYIIEKISGQTLGRFLEERIFRPLKMVDSGFVVPKEKVGRFATAYVTDGTSRRLVDARSTGGFRAQDFTQPPPFESGGGGLVSTIDDYARFAQMLANDGALEGVRILSPATVELMRTNVVTPAAQAAPDASFDENVGFGLDLMVIANPRGAGRLEGKGTMSWEGAAGTFFWVDPANDVVYVQMLQNFSRAAPLNSLDALARPLVYQALVDPEK
jgi:CubicO group peptidase (beta-lactamase class C family)